MAISGAFGGRYLQPAVMLGAQAALPKPLSTAALLEAVRQVMRLGPHAPQTST